MFYNGSLETNETGKTTRLSNLDQEYGTSAMLLHEMHLAVNAKVIISIACVFVELYFIYFKKDMQQYSVWSSEKEDKM